jgi:hypothetical protein
MENKKRQLIRNFLLELLVYGALILVYVLTVLRLLSPWFTELFDTNLVAYAVVGLVLILFQAVVLDTVTSFLIRLLGLERLE